MRQYFLLKADASKSIDSNILSIWWMEGGWLKDVKQPMQIEFVLTQKHLIH